MPYSTNDTRDVPVPVAYQEAFDKLFRAYYPRLYLFAEKMLGNGPLAGAIVQNCFTSFWKNRRPDNTPSGCREPIDPRLYTAVYQAVQHHQNSQTSIKNVNDQPKFESLIWAETLYELSSALNGLSPACRQVLEMYFKEEKSSRQISNELQLQETTVDLLKMKGLEMIRRNLGYVFLISFFC